VHVCTNGYAFLSNAGTPAPGPADWSPTTAEFTSGPPRVAPLWTDLTMLVANNADVLIENSSGAFCTITWKNAVNYGSAVGSPVFDLQLKLWITGDVDCYYTANTTNMSTLLGGEVAIVGLTPGGGAVLPAPVDYLAGGATNDVTVFEQWTTAQSFDLVSNSLQLFAANPGYAFVAPGPQTNCSSSSTYGVGCISQPDRFYEVMPIAGFDLTNTVTMLRQGTGYIVLDSIPGTFVPPGANAAVIAVGDDAYSTVALSGAMPIANGGATSNLTVCSNSYIALSANQPSALADYSPTVAEFEAFTEPTVAFPWHDYANNSGGDVFFEEVSGIAYVTFNDVASYANALPGDTFQYQFHVGTGDITIVFQAMNNQGTAAWSNYLCGYTVGPAGTSSQSFDLSVDLASVITVGDFGIAPLTLGSTAPLIGGSWDLTTSNIDPVSPIAITFVSDSALPAGVPLPLIGLPAPGCSAYLSSILGDLTGVNAGGSAVVSLPIPNVPGLAGVNLAAQSVCLTLATPLNLLSSNGASGAVGY
jgi:hypothetical protein